MRHPLHIDFETASELNVTKTGIYRYATDRATFVRCFAATWGQHEGVYFDPNYAPDWLLDALADDRVEVHAHNAGFERGIITNLCGPRHNWPVPELDRYFCSAARARRMAIPGALDKAGLALEVPQELMKSKRGKLLLSQLSKPARIKKADPLQDVTTFSYDTTKLDELAEYCFQDVIAEEAIEDRTYPLPERERAYYLMTERMNDRGIRVDVPLIERLIERTAEATEELNLELNRLTSRAVRAVTSVPALKKWVIEQGVPVEKLDADAIEELIKQDDLWIDPLPDDVRRALEIRQAGASSSIKKFPAILRRLEAGSDRLKGSFIYHGASTGRYTSGGAQLQNLPRKTHKDWDSAVQRLPFFTLDEIMKCLRGVFVPAPGHRFIDADYNAVEGRGVAWLAGAGGLLNSFRNGEDVYCVMATLIFGKVVTKADEYERFVGKQVVLGAGYGLGWKKFQAMCLQYGVIVSDATAQLAIWTYRKINREIPWLWRDMERAALDATYYKGEVFSIPSEKVSFLHHEGYLRMRLPSERTLFYKRPQIAEGLWPDGSPKGDVLTFLAENQKTRQWLRETTWGGTLVENAVQAICRDLLFEAQLRLETEFGIPVVLSAHDQLIAEVPVEDAEKARIIVQKCMLETREWARGFPLVAEPVITERFGK